MRPCSFNAFHQRLLCHDEGSNITCTDEVTIQLGAHQTVRTGLAIKCPHGTYRRLASRSRLSAKHGIEVGAGAIDRDYLGEIRVNLHNHGCKPFTIAPGMRIAQSSLERNTEAELHEATHIDTAIRGCSGFGSTGLTSPGEETPAPLPPPFDAPPPPPLELDMGGGAGGAGSASSGVEICVGDDVDTTRRDNEDVHSDDGSAISVPRTHEHAPVEIEMTERGTDAQLSCVSESAGSHIDLIGASTVIKKWIADTDWRERQDFTTIGSSVRTVSY